MNNIFKISIFAGALIAVLALSDMSLAQNKSAGRNAGETKKAKPKDPFQFNNPKTDDGFMPAMNQTIPAGIKVLGIIVTENKPPLAALKIPNYDEPFYVREKDVIGVEMAVPGSKNKKMSKIIYLKIDSITPQQVVIVPKDHPEGKQILR